MRRIGIGIRVWCWVRIGGRGRGGRREIFCTDCVLLLTFTLTEAAESFGARIVVKEAACACGATFKAAIILVDFDIFEANHPLAAVEAAVGGAEAGFSKECLPGRRGRRRRHHGRGRRFWRRLGGRRHLSGRCRIRAAGQRGRGAWSGAAGAGAATSSVRATTTARTGARRRVSLWSFGGGRGCRCCSCCRRR